MIDYVDPAVAVIGPTTWGTALAILLARKGLSVCLVARTDEEADRLARSRQNSRRLPGIAFPDTLHIGTLASERVKAAGVLLLAVPSQTVRENLRAALPYLSDHLLLINAGKGLELGTNKRMSEVIAEEAPPHLAGRVCVLSGPNLSKEMVAGKPASAVVASPRIDAAVWAQKILMGPTFRIYTSTDVVGVELGGALKNVIALGAGICDGLGYGDNARAALITRGLAEITRLGHALGANPLTFAGLAGLGDLVATCSSQLSRNHQVGVKLAQGIPLSEIFKTMHEVAEGVNTTVAARALAAQTGVEMPITEQMYRVLFEGHDPLRAVTELMARDPKEENADFTRNDSPQRHSEGTLKSSC